MDCLEGCQHDSPVVNKVKIPALLFADDTLLISRTPSGLENLLSEFNNYCTKKGLEINKSKIKVMAINPHHSFKGKIRLAGVGLDLVKSIDYLGICLDNNASWQPHLEKSKNILVQRAGAITRLHNRSPIIPLSPVMEIYRAKAQSASLYGARSEERV